MSKTTMHASLAEALDERALREKRPHGFGRTVSNQILANYIRTLEASLLAMPADAPLVDLVTDSMIAESMLCVDDPLSWHAMHSSDALTRKLREFSHALAERLSVAFASREQARPKS